MTDSRLTAAPIPAWVPRLVADIALRLPDSPIVRRLLTDARMEAVWRKLAKQPPNNVPSHDTRLLYVERDGATLGLTRADLAGHSPSERGAASFFVSILTAFMESPTLRTRVDYDAQAKRFIDAVDLCREEREHSAGALRDALDIVGRHFAYSARNMETVSGPDVVERAGGDRSDDDLRLRIRRLAAVSLLIYGKRNFTTLATVLSVATARDVTKKMIENATRDLRLKS